MTWEFLDYVDAAGHNAIKRWIASLDARAQKEVKAALNAQIRILATAEKLDRTVDVGIMRRECKGLLELIMLVDKVQYRPLAWYGPDRGEVTIYGGAIERGGRLEPPGACKSALDRKADLAKNVGKAIPHDFT